MAGQPLSGKSQPAASTETPVAIPAGKSQLAERISDVIGDETLASFSRRSGIHESTLRAYMKRGLKPGLDHLVAICRVGNISLDWLATGRPPVHRVPVSEAPITFEDPDRLRTALAAVEEGLRASGRMLPPDKYADLVVAAYELLGTPDAQGRAKVLRLIKAVA